MQRIMLALVLGVVLGVAGTVAAVEISGGWWEYRILDDALCHQSRSLGTSHVAPNQPNPCLIRSPRFMGD